MKDSIIIDTLNLYLEKKNVIQIENEVSFNWWIVLSVLEVLVILYLLIRLQRIKKDQYINDDFSELNQAKSAHINMSDLMNNINDSRDLYKSLSRKCHPDRFQDESLKLKADILFQEITQNKRNYKKLLEIKNEAESQLKINI